MTTKPTLDRLLTVINDLTNGNKKRFAEMLGVTPSYIDGWTNKGIFPSAEQLANIQEKLHISIDWLLTGKGERYIIPSPLAGEGKGEGYTREPAPPYGIFLADDVTEEEKAYIKKLIRILHTKQEKTVLAIKQNIDAFLDTPNKSKVKKTASNE